MPQAPQRPPPRLQNTPLRLGSHRFQAYTKFFPLLRLPAASTPAHVLFRRRQLPESSSQVVPFSDELENDSLHMFACQTVARNALCKSDDTQCLGRAFRPVSKKAVAAAQGNSFSG